MTEYQIDIKDILLESVRNIEDVDGVELILGVPQFKFVDLMELEDKVKHHFKVHQAGCIRDAEDVLTMFFNNLSNLANKISTF